MPFRGEYSLEVPGGLVGVVGRYEGQEGRSNRAGKSAFLDAILYALYDEARGAKVLEIGVRQDDERVRALYTRLGFLPHHRVEGGFVPGGQVLYLRRAVLAGEPHQSSE